MRAAITKAIPRPLIMDLIISRGSRVMREDLGFPLSLAKKRQLPFVLLMACIPPVIKVLRIRLLTVDGTYNIVFTHICIFVYTY